MKVTVDRPPRPLDVVVHVRKSGGEYEMALEDAGRFYAHHIVGGARVAAAVIARVWWRQLDARACRSRRPRVRAARNVAHAYADIGRALVRLLPPLARAAITALKEPTPTRRYLS